MSVETRYELGQVIDTLIMLQAMKSKSQDKKMKRLYWRACNELEAVRDALKVKVRNLNKREVEERDAV